MGVLKNILRDQGTQFTFRLRKQTLNDLEVKVICSSIWRPLSNLPEKVMLESSRLCRKYCHDHHNPWSYELANFEQFLNKLVHESPGFTPSQLRL